MMDMVKLQAMASEAILDHDPPYERDGEPSRDPPCQRCGDFYALRDGCDPTALCDPCAHEVSSQLAAGVIDLADRLTAEILTCNRMRAECVRAEIARDRMSADLEQLRSDFAAEQSALAKVERDLGDAEREIETLRHNVREAFG